MITKTRKIELYFNSSDKEKVSEFWNTWRKYNRITHRAANLVVTHQYMQDKIKDIFYINDGTRVKLENMAKDESGILNTSRSNSTYQVLSKHFKGECPTDILTNINSAIVKYYKSEAKEVFYGYRSLRTYRKNIPIPFSSSSIHNMVKETDGNYSFSLFKTPFITHFGHDNSDNETVVDMAYAGKYKICACSIMLSGKKIFLNFVFQFEKISSGVDPKRVCYAELGVDIPVRYEIDYCENHIGNIQEFLHRRIQIQKAKERAQIISSYNRGGHGRMRKLKMLGKYSNREKNYVNTKIHQYTSQLVNQCLKYKCGTLVLKNQTKKEEEAKDQKLLLRNWSYYGMKDKLSYKCNQYGIKLIIEEDDKQEESKKSNVPIIETV